ncbi:MAG: FadR family transcriptional regulator [Chloroflexi bacterium]|nr:FadR family transcriptional regulator [Chloroflexota bacterium]
MEPISREFLFDKVADSIIELVRVHNLQPGDKIPTEVELSRALQVSRTSIREAIRGLVATGVLEQQQGIGTRVAQPSMVALMAHGPLPSLLATSEQLEYFIEARLVLEPEMTAIAAIRAKPEDLEKIRDALDAMANAGAAGIADEGKPLEDFHSAMLDATHNPVLIQLCGPIIGLLNQLQRPIVSVLAPVSPKEFWQARMELHRPLYEAVCSGDPVLARKEAIEHIEQAHAELRRIMAQRESLDQQSGHDEAALAHATS